MMQTQARPKLTDRTRNEVRILFDFRGTLKSDDRPILTKSGQIQSLASNDFFHHPKDFPTILLAHGGQPT